MTGLDASEVHALRAELQQANPKTVQGVNKALEITGRNVKDDARALAAGQVGRHGKQYPSKMQYTKHGGAGYSEVQVGPRPGGQGDLAPIFETGNPFSGRKPALEPALEYNMDDFLKGIEKAIEDGLSL